MSIYSSTFSFFSWRYRKVSVKYILVFYIEYAREFQCQALF